jgi:Ran GTPase-activating protein (RanGAP) involved in mRNA processing and transport
VLDTKTTLAFAK